MMHSHHPSLPDYDPDAVLHDGCPECEERADLGLVGLLNLDEDNVRKLWMVMLDTEWSKGEGINRPKSACDARLVRQLYRVAVLLERNSRVDPWGPLDELRIKASALTDALYAAARGDR